MFAKSAIVLVVLVPLFAADPVATVPGLTVHEWGTFTSVASADGSPMEWSPLSAPTELPCFVYRLPAQCVKCAPSTVRMETPVLYFYAPQPATVSIKVGFPNGLITEWFPRAASVLPPGPTTYTRSGQIDWGQVQIGVDDPGEFRHDGSGSHYYAARATDAAPLRVNGQYEKLLFYRGIASEGVFLSAQWLRDGKLQLRRIGPVAPEFALVFENRGGKTGYRVVRDLREPVVLDPPELTADVTAVQGELAEALTAAGLYPKEAAAMIETWRDSWFEEGMRVFYLVPQPSVDRLLPLKISPAPQTTMRVFVGRVEVLSPYMQHMIETALANTDIAVLSKCGRFLDPFLAMINKGRVSPAVRAFMNQERARAAQPPAPCKAEPFSVPTDNPLQ